MSLKQKPSVVFPDIERIPDAETRRAFSDLFKILQGSFLDTFDDTNQAARWEVDGAETQLVTADEIDMQSKKISNVTDPASAQDAATKAYADGKISKTTAAEISAMTEKTTLADGDHFLIEDSAASNAKKRVQKSNVASDKISKTTAAEISAMTEKTTLADADLFLIEDSAAGNAKKKVQKSNFAPKSGELFISNTSFSGAATTGNIDITAGNVYKAIISMTWGVTDAALTMQFNNDASSVYEYGESAATEDDVTENAGAAGGAPDSVFPLYVGELVLAGSFLMGELTIMTDRADSTEGTIIGTIYYRDQSGDDKVVTIGGKYNGASAITSFVLEFGGINCTGNVYLYQKVLS